MRHSRSGVAADVASSAHPPLQSPSADDDWENLGDEVQDAYVHRVAAMLPEGADTDVRVVHTALHGVGPWTADIYLLFCLGHADAFPSGDLAVQESARLALGLRKRPDAKALAKIAEAWRPWRGVAAHLLWAYYHVVKKRDVVPVQPNGRPKEAAGTKTPKRKKKNG